MGARLILVVGVVVVLGVVVGNPAPPSIPQSSEANHVDDVYLDDALGDWLSDFDTYTFMVKQGIDTHGEEADEEEGEGVAADGETQDEDAMEEEEEEEETRKEWSAPIAVSVGSQTLLHPELDYHVTVESLVAEEGSIFMTLSKYNNETKCGVGGLSVERGVQDSSPRTTSGEVNVAHVGAVDHQTTTFISFSPQQDNSTSQWLEVSPEYWWARGHLVGGGMLSITFTPPECGCLTLSTYYALPVGNMTLVVGPQAYPKELQTLLCIDPTTSNVHQEENVEETVDYIQEPSALIAPRSTDEEVVDDSESEVVESASEPSHNRGSRGQSHAERKRKKKAKRQMKRQKIRQAGRRQARKQKREEAGRRSETRRQSRKQRKRVRAWRKLQKKGKKKGHKHHHGLNHHEHVNGSSTENITHHHHSNHNASAIHQEERLVDMLLREPTTDNSTVSDETVETAEGRSAVENEDTTSIEGEENLTPRQQRKNRRQRKKMLRKERKNAYPPGVKFCCKQGVKHKKNYLVFNSSSSEAAEETQHPHHCTNGSAVVAIFAHHQFGIDEAACVETYNKCCSRFTSEIWDTIKARKVARRMERKQRRKSRRKGKGHKHQRKQERRMRKERRRNQDHNNEECAGENCGHTN